MTELMSQIGYDDEGRLLLLPKNFEALLTQVIENKSSIDDIEVTAPDGSAWSWFFYHLVADDEDRVHGIATNITERIRREAIEKDLEATAAKMREDARKQEIAKLTHEFRSPLNSLVGFAGILKAKLKGRVDQQEQTFLDLIEKGGMKLADQISETLDAARDNLSEHPLAISKFGTQAVCDELIAQLMPLATKKFLDLRCECEDLTLETDRAKLVQILVNFLDNAIKYTGKGSVTLIGKPLPDAYEFSVIDTGRGLTDEEQVDVFKDFHRTSGVEGIQGTGLGLSVGQELARRLQAQIAVESVFGQGSRFLLRVPV
jgi:signal transduction histidine kinase